MTADKKGRTFTVDRVGAIRHAEIEIRPGVNELRGPNGAGKTTAIEAITRAAGDSTVKLTARDGASRGFVKGGGVTLTVGRVTRTTGEPAVELADFGALADLIEPPLKGREERSNARIRAFMKLAEIECTDEDLGTLAGADAAILEALEGSTFPDLLTAAETVRKTANAIAKDLENRAESFGAKAAGHRERLDELGEVRDVDGTVEELQGAAEEAVRLEIEREASYHARVDLEERQERIRESLGKRPDLEELAVAREEAEATVDRLEAELEEATRRMGRAIREHEEGKRSAETFDARQAVLAEPLQGATLEELNEAQSAVETTRERVRFALARDERATHERAAKASEEEAGDYKELGERLRDVARSVSSRVAEILEARGLPGLTIEDGELAVVWEDGKAEAFDRLSLGQKTRVAADVLARGAHGKTVPLDPALWHSLDPPAKAEVAQIFAEAGLEVLTETATSGEDISVAHYGGDGE